jgi:hypothetical protein
MIGSFGDEADFRLVRRTHGVGGRLDFEVLASTGVVGRAVQRRQTPMQWIDRYLMTKEVSASAVYDVTDPAGNPRFVLAKRRTRIGGIDATLTGTDGRVVGRVRRPGGALALARRKPAEVLDGDSVLVAQLVGFGIPHVVDRDGEQVAGVGLLETPEGPAIRNRGGFDVRFFPGVPNETKLLCLAALIVFDRAQHE